MTRKFLLIIFLTSTLIMNAQNPLLGTFDTPHGTYPFSQIKPEHYLPAFEQAISEHAAQIDSIANNPEAPSFANTIEAYEAAGERLNIVEGIFYNLTNSDSDEHIQEIELKVAPMLSEHSNQIRLNEQLFARIKKVYQQREKLKLTTEQQTLLKKVYDSFADNGANLSDNDKQKYRELTTKLSNLSIQFSQNILKETNSWQKHVTDKELLQGIPENVMTLMHEQAQAKGLDGWLLNLKPTTYIPVLKYADNRELRHEIWYAYSTRCCHGGEYDNQQIVKEIVNTRLQIAKLLGNDNYAQYVLKKRMAGNIKGVYNLLDELKAAYYPVAKKEYEELREFARDINLQDTILQPWDWSYYSEKLKQQRYNISDEILRPYFELSKVKKGVFGLAEKLYGIHFEPAPDIEVYHPEVEAFRVLDEKGHFLAVLYTDFHPRDTKRGGAWMSEFKGQWRQGKNDSRPHIVIVMNFTRPTADTPALLTLDEVTTFLHEFGHSLHGMLTRCQYQSLSGTSVYRDFVELPSQFMENYAFEKQFIDLWAEHYQTGEKLPEELITKIRQASNYHAAYACVRQLSFGYLDMAWHSLTEPFEGNVIDFEKKAMQPTDVLPVDPTTCMSTSFSHIFSGGYAAGYYGYKWAEVLDADAFSAFKEKGLFSKKMAKKFRKNILEKGGTEDPAKLYLDFRGKPFTIEALLQRDGIKKAPATKKRTEPRKVQSL